MSRLLSSSDLAHVRSVQAQALEQFRRLREFYDEISQFVDESIAVLESPLVTDADVAAFVVKLVVMETRERVLEAEAKSLVWSPVEKGEVN